MRSSGRYAKIVEWSEEDRSYVGSAPGLILGGCHGDDEKQVFGELCRIVDEVIDLHRPGGKPGALWPYSGALQLGSRVVGLTEDRAGELCVLTNETFGPYGNTGKVLGLVARP